MDNKKECCGKCITISRIVPDDGNIDAYTNEKCNCHSPHDTEESWEKEFDKLPRDLHCENALNEFYVKSFIRTLLEKQNNECFTLGVSRGLEAGHKAALTECVEMVREMGEAHLYYGDVIKALQEKMK